MHLQKIMVCSLDPPFSHHWVTSTAGRVCFIGVKFILLHLEKKVVYKYLYNQQFLEAQSDLQNTTLHSQWESLLDVRSLLHPLEVFLFGRGLSTSTSLQYESYNDSPSFNF